MVHEGTRVYKAADGTLTTGVHGRGPKARATRAIVLATGSPINHDVAVHARQEASRTYVVGLAVAKGAVPRANFWDTQARAL